MKKRLNIYKTNWITVIGIFLSVYIMSVITSVLNDQLGIGEALFGGLIGVLAYGFMFWLGFLILLFVLDVLLIGTGSTKLNQKLILEWCLVSAPFIYWFFKYTEWVWLVAVITFLITQFIRRKKIVQILHH